MDIASSVRAAGGERLLHVAGRRRLSPSDISRRFAGRGVRKGALQVIEKGRGRCARQTACRVERLQRDVRRIGKRIVLIVIAIFGIGLGLCACGFRRTHKPGDDVSGVDELAGDSGPDEAGRSCKKLALRPPFRSRPSGLARASGAEIARPREILKETRLLRLPI